MLKMIRGKDTCVINRIKSDDGTFIYTSYKVVVTTFPDGKPNHYTEIYDGKRYRLDVVIKMAEQIGYIPFETPEEWDYKYYRM